mmetsp:Transcript_53418/g.117267  ORF Transcript_53418/g.117267 Transcript_53418/m.117267 type:complete len:207 (-) Transcript_53418:310-930(-)
MFLHELIFSQAHIFSNQLDTKNSKSVQNDGGSHESPGQRHQAVTQTLDQHPQHLELRHQPHGSCQLQKPQDPQHHQKLQPVAVTIHREWHYPGRHNATENDEAIKPAPAGPQKSEAVGKQLQGELHSKNGQKHMIQRRDDSLRVWTVTLHVSLNTHANGIHENQNCHYQVEERTAHDVETNNSNRRSQHILVGGRRHQTLHLGSHS